MEGNNKFVWHDRYKELPPKNVPVLCKVKATKRTYEMIPHGNPIRYKFAVHWIMDDGGWEISEEATTIIEWCYIYHNGELITKNDKKY